MNWAQTRAKSRRAVHKTFGVPATYTVAATSAQYPITARLHRKTESIGQGADFPMHWVEEDRIVLLLDDLPGLIAKGDTVYFEDEDVTATIDVVEPETPPSVACRVSLRDGI